MGHKPENELQREQALNKMVLGGPKTKFLADVDPEQKNKTYATDKSPPILWYSVESSIKDQAKFLIHELIPDMRVKREVNNADILWILNNLNKNENQFRNNSLCYWLCYSAS